MYRILLLSVVLALAASAPGFAAPRAVISQGVLAGSEDERVAVFKNIPYAAPPVGALRWRAPQPAPHWAGMRDATAFGPACPQAAASRFTPQPMRQSEDCLSLNIWTPHHARRAKLPVMVWIYGGGMRLGESGTPLYDGVGLAHHGVVIVSFNYRLAFLGYFAHPALAAESPTDPIGNYGLMDQVAALKWVRANISRFGGDPRNVTIFGESAGGQSVDDSMISPLARGLFHKAIAESSLGLADMTDRTDAVQLAIRVASDLGVSGNDQVALAKLRALSVADIMDAFNKVSATNYTLPSQMVDGRLIPDQVARLFAEGRLARVPFIIGSNSDEGGAMAALGISPDRLTAALGDESAAVRALYEQSGPISDADFLRQFFGDQLFGAGAQALAGYVVRSGQLAYVYNFAYVADARRGATGGVGHGGELPFVFGVHGLEHTPMGGMLARAMTDKDRRMIDLVQTYWTNFAKTGDPNSAGMPPWPRYSIDRQSTLVLNDEMTAVPHFRAAYYAPAYVAWSKRSGQPLPFPVTLGPLASRQPN